MYQLTASIVLYKPTESIFCTIESFLRVNQLETSLYLIDNSPTNEFQKKNKQLLENKKIKYIFLGKNIGYGKAHNIALKKAVRQSLYHLVLNPDINFEEGTLENIYAYMQKHNDIGQLMPKVLYPDGNIQYVCKLIPSPFNLMARLLPKSLLKNYNENFELRFSGYDKLMNVPYLSGCFMFLRCTALKEIGFFDERFFMYPEDIDLTRRMHKKYKTIFYPQAHIYHDHAKSSFKSLHMFKIHLTNMFKYFNKWGWIFDAERKKINKETLKKLKTQ